MSTHALEIKNLKKSYGKNVAVDGISFSIEQGEFFGLLGPNGAGKTTTIHCITGIGTITSGSISILGLDVVKEYRETRKKIGLSPQDYNVDIFAKVWKILDYAGGYYGMRKKERMNRIEKVLAECRLTEHKEKAFQHLSGGLKRRLMLARALMHDPEILILDEPTAGIDVEFRHELWEFLRKLNKSGKTIILTSHYLEEVELLCSRIGIIHKGNLAALGRKDEFVKDGKKLEDKYLIITRGEHF
ncbi:MAG: ABC transporter ATP-binding protein [Parcubacteria group bacterium]|nr:ABC transporter ATP-binding protein [Parcubacteria group bacterium]